MAGRPLKREKERRVALETTPIRRIGIDHFHTDVTDPLEIADLSARPVDPQIIRNLARLHMDAAEIAAVIEAPLEQVEAVWGPVIKQGNQEALVALKRKRMEVAMRGNVQMLLYLSEQLLKEVPAPRTNVNVEVPADDMPADPKERLSAVLGEISKRFQGKEVKALPTASPGSEPSTEF